MTTRTVSSVVVGVAVIIDKEATTMNEHGRVSFQRFYHDGSDSHGISVKLRPVGPVEGRNVCRLACAYREIICAQNTRAKYARGMNETALSAPLLYTWDTYQNSNSDGSGQATSETYMSTFRRPQGCPSYVHMYYCVRGTHYNIARLNLFRQEALSCLEVGVGVEVTLERKAIHLLCMYT